MTQLSMRIFSAFFCFATCSLPTVSADVHISKEYPFPPSLIAELERSLQTAKDRGAELQEFPTAIPLQREEHVVLWCPAHTPDSRMQGCSLHFTLPSQGFHLSLSKNLALPFTSQQITQRLSALNPNTVTDHQQFGSPFSPEQSFGSHYFCQPEGEAGSKTWQCYLYVHERFASR